MHFFSQTHLKGTRWGFLKSKPKTGDVKGAFREKQKNVIMYDFWVIANLLCLKNPGGSRAHAVDRPVCVAVFVADGDGEPSIVGPDDLNDLTRLARNCHLLALASVGSLVSSPIGALA